MKLVELLAAGVNGAENGTATFVLRGTASSAASVLYSDFEGTTQPGTNIITLDSHGAAEVYCNAYVDVTLKTSGGSTLRTVTIGNTATTTEVISDSFTGTSYTGSPTAVSQPITLAAVLDKWDNSAGADDWKVAVNGVATNLSSAFSALAGLFFNVKDPTYGAVGDGTTDDTTAIGLAITAASAAGGGIVFFPPSTSFYKFTTLTISQDNITLMGAGPRASVLQSASTSSANVIFSAASGACSRVQDLSIKCSAANANPVIQANAGVKLLLNNCEVTANSITGACIRKTSGATASRITINDCEITVGSGCTQIVSNAATDNACFIRIDRTKFVAAAGFTGVMVSGPNFIVNNCIFDGSLITSGSCIHVDLESTSVSGKYLGTVTNSTFVDGGSTSYVFWLAVIATGTDFTENNNTFIGFTIPSALTSADNIYAVSHNSQDAYRAVLGSRKGRTLEITQASTGTLTMLAFASYENVFVNYTAAGNSTLKAPIAVMTNGCECNLVLQNNDTSTRTITIDYGETPQTYGPQNATSGSDLALSVIAADRVVAFMKFMHFGTGAPLAFVPVPVTD